MLFWTAILEKTLESPLDSKFIGLQTAGQDLATEQQFVFVQLFDVCSTTLEAPWGQEWYTFAHYCAVCGTWHLAEAQYILMNKEMKISLLREGYFAQK